MPRKLTDYRSFWVVWLGSAGSPSGRSLFSIQKEWGIRTNYLYHREPGIGKPMYKAMLDEGYLRKEGRKLIPLTKWIPEYVVARHSSARKGEWSLDLMVVENWSLVQEFIEKNMRVLFSPDNMRLLYQDLEGLSGMGRFVFDDIFKAAIVMNILPYCTRYKANLVAKIMFTMLSMSPGRRLLDYFNSIKEGIGEKGIPMIMSDESTLIEMLYPVK